VIRLQLSVCSIVSDTATISSHTRDRQTDRQTDIGNISSDSNQQSRTSQFVMNINVNITNC